MLLRYLELNNFLSHEHERISFPQEGLFLLAGESGSGKSSMIVDAVAYALFGPAATRARKQAELLHEDHPGQPLSVKAMFDFAEGERLIVERGYDSKGSTFAKVYAPNPDDPDNATLLAEGAQPVARFLSKRLGGMNWQQFYAAFVARQSEISNLTTLKGADRKKLIHRMLGMRELEKAAELISGRLRRAKAEVEQLQRQVGGGFDLKEARAKLQEATERVEAEQERLSEAQSELAVKRAELEEAEEALRPLQEAVAAAQELERRSAAIEAQEGKVAQLRERVERHEEAQKVVVAELEIKAEHDEAAATRDELRDTYARSAKHQERRDELAALLERQSELRLKVDLPVSTPVTVGAGGDVDNDQDAGEQGQELTAEAARSRREVLRANVKRRAEEIAERSEQLERLRESGECYACQRPFSSEHDHDQVMRGLEAALEELRAEQKADEEEGKRIAANLPTLEEIEKLAEEERSLRRSIAELEADGAVREDLEALAGEGKEAKARVEELAEKLAAIGAAKRDLAPEAKSELEEAERALDEARADARDLQQKAADESDVEKHRQLSEQVTELQGAVAALQAQVPERERACEEAKRELAGLEREFEGRKADLAVHARYTRQEVIAALGHAAGPKPKVTQGGILWVPEAASDVFFVDLRKSERDYSPTTMYRDYAINRELFHWESQSRQAPHQPTVRRYIEHARRGTSILLFVREHRRDDLGTAPFHFLGPATYVSHLGERPVAFTWRLQTPMPEELFEVARSVAAA